jgi:hypothetical protein
MDALADSFEHGFMVLVFEECLKYVVAGQNDACRVNTEAAADDSKGTLGRRVGRALYDRNRGALDRIGNVSWCHHLVCQALDL